MSGGSGAERPKIYGDFELPLELFGFGTPEEISERQLLHQEEVVLGYLVQRFQLLKVTAATEHFQGCAQRLQMMRHARHEIYRVSTTRKKPLDSFTLVHLNICLNSFYMNLLGALDNLAWATAHEFTLLPVIAESDDGTRKFCGLDRKKFATALKKHRPAAESVLAGIQTWIIDVKKFRDPAAHRLPLSMPPGVMTVEEGERYRALHEQAMTALLAGKHEEYDALSSKANALGRFVPLLNKPRGPDDSVYVVPAQMAADQRRFLKFVNDYLPLFDEPLADATGDPTPEP